MFFLNSCSLQQRFWESSDDSEEDGSNFPGTVPSTNSKGKQPAVRGVRKKEAPTPYSRNAKRGQKTISHGSSQHNEVEKRRRAHLAECYNKLKTVLPKSSAKASNVSVLKSAVDEIRALDKEQKQLIHKKEEQLRLRDQLQKKKVL